MHKNIIITLFVLSGFYSKAQVNLDSLYAVWQDESQSDSIRSKAYSDYIWDGFLFSQPDSAFILAEELVSFGLDNNYPKFQAGGYTIQGVSWANRSDYSQTLDYYTRALEIYQQIDDPSGIALALNNVGTIYDKQSDYPKALDYYLQSLEINEQLGHKYVTGVTLSNIGVIYMKQGDFPKALDYNLRSLEYNEKMGYKNEAAVALNNIGAVYQNQGDYSKALDYFIQSLEINEQIGQQSGIARSLTKIGEIYQIQEDYPKAINYCQRGYELSLRIESLEIQKYGCSCLYSTYKAMGDGNNALKYHELIVVIEESLQAEETSKKLQQMEFQKVMFQDSIAQLEADRLVLEAHQEEVRKKNRTRNLLAVGGILVLILAAGIYGRLRYTRKTKAIIEKEKDRSNNLLLNILPADIAEELKIHGKAEARDFDMVSILFSDFKGFTEASAKLSAVDLVGEINHCFEAFDGIMEKYKIEKIKTIGDAYMAAGGLPVPTDESVKNTVLAAIEMQAFISKRKTDMDASDKPAFEMRVGIHTGPVVAGIVGVKKFQYDIWGDTVNTASRVESNGEIAKVNISQDTYKLLKDDPDFSFESRGKIEAKGKGEIEMYFVTMNWMKKKNGVQQNL